MIVSDIGQARVFLINILFGMMCVLLFDFFYVITKRYGKNMTMVNIFDALYFITVFCLVLYAGVKFNLGALRYYQIFGLLGGMFFQWLLFSKPERKMIEIILYAGVKIFRFIMHILWVPISFLLRAVFSLISFAEEKIMHASHKLKRNLKKVKLKRDKRNKTVKKRIKMI